MMRKNIFVTKKLLVGPGPIIPSGFLTCPVQYLYADEIGIKLMSRAVLKGIREYISGSINNLVYVA